MMMEIDEFSNSNNINLDELNKICKIDSFM